MVGWSQFPQFHSIFSAGRAIISHQAHKHKNQYEKHGQVLILARSNISHIQHTQAASNATQDTKIGIDQQIVYTSITVAYKQLSTISVINIRNILQLESE